MYPYPQASSEITWWTIALHIILLILATMPFVFLMRRSKREATSSDLWLLALAFTFVTLFISTLAHEADSNERPFFLGYLLYFYMVISVTFGVVSVRLRRQQGSTPVVAVFLSCLGLFVLILLLLPAVPSAREAARRMSCSNNLKQIALAMHNYGSKHGFFPEPIGQSEQGYSISWRVTLLPFLERQSLYDSYDQAHPWDGESNRPLHKSDSARGIYSCPSVPLSRAVEDGLDGLTVFSAYTIPQGTDAVSSRLNEPYESLIKSHGVNLLVLEACGQEIIWSEPREVELSDDSLGVNLPGYQPGQSRAILSSHHAGGANAARVNGAVSFISDKIDPEVLRQLCGPEPVNELGYFPDAL